MRKCLWPFGLGGTTPCVAVVIASMLLGLTDSALAADVTIVTNFPANKGPGYRKPYPDAAGAVGPKHTVVLDDRAFVVQDKATGKVLQNRHAARFLAQGAAGQDVRSSGQRSAAPVRPAHAAMDRMGSRAQARQRIPGRFDDLRSDRAVEGSQDADSPQ